MKYLNFTQQILLFTLLLTSYLSFSANIIFDLNGVLVKSHTLSSVWQIGPTNFFGYYNPLHFETYLYDFLQLCESDHQFEILAEHKGQPLPPILCEWLNGTKTCAEILERISSAIENNPIFFQQYCPKKLIRSTTNFMFTPEKFIKSIRINKKGYRLFKKCRKLSYHTGQPVHKIFILSNWDAESYQLLKNKSKIGYMLHAADGHIISGNVHLIKPDPAIYELLFETYNIDPDKETTVYIDDELINIRAADSLNKKHMYNLHCTSFTEVKKQLRILNIIP